MANRRLQKQSLLAIALLACTPAAAQFPDKFTNLKVLPKNISKRELESTMRGFTFALGVRCDHCHVEKKAPEKGLDFPADDQDAKKTARVMLQMVAAVNHDYISKVIKAPPDTPAIEVQCVTCHHGLTQPQPLSIASLQQQLDNDCLLLESRLPPFRFLPGDAQSFEKRCAPDWFQDYPRNSHPLAFETLISA